MSLRFTPPRFDLENNPRIVFPSGHKKGAGINSRIRPLLLVDDGAIVCIGENSPFFKFLAQTVIPLVGEGFGRGHIARNAVDADRAEDAFAKRLF
ncbi:MAG: hypothetical protein ACYDBL_13960 [Candidatus Acidiferrales bacterium]